MSNRIFQIKSFFRFVRKAQTRYYIHSPFVFHFAEDLLADRRSYYAFDEIYKLRKELLKSNEKFEHIDMGAGGQDHNKSSRVLKSVNQLAKHASMPAKYGEMLFKLVNKYEPKIILELGTCLGIGTAYMAKPSSKNKVHTIEADPFLVQKAKSNFELLNLGNINTYEGNFDVILPRILAELHTIDLAFIDGNHQYKPTMGYYQAIKQKLNEESIVILDDIHWSSEMEQAWETIKLDKDISLSIDLYRMGILFFRKGRVREDFSLIF